MPGRKKVLSIRRGDNQSLWLIRCVKVKKVCLQRQSLKFAGQRGDRYLLYPLVTDKKYKSYKNRTKTYITRWTSLEAFP